MLNNENILCVKEILLLPTLLIYNYLLIPIISNFFRLSFSLYESDNQEIS